MRRARRERGRQRWTCAVEGVKCAEIYAHTTSQRRREARRMGSQVPGGWTEAVPDTAAEAEERGNRNTAAQRRVAARGRGANGAACSAVCCKYA